MLSIWNGCRNSLQAIAISTKLITYVSSFRNQWQATIWSFFSNAIKRGKWSFLVIWWSRYVTIIDSIAVSPTCYVKSEFAYFQNNLKQHSTFHVVVAPRIKSGMYQKVWCMHSWFCQGAKATTTTTAPIAFEFHSKARALLALLHFLVHFFDVHGAATTWNFQCHVLWGREQTTSGANLSLFFWIWIQSLRSQLQENSPIFDKLSRGKTDVIKFIWKKRHSFFVMFSLLSSFRGLFNKTFTSVVYKFSHCFRLWK